MDFNPAEIRRMMEMRKKELRGKHSAESGESVQSPTKRSRSEKENIGATSSASSSEPTSPPKVQGFMAKFAISPKNPRRDAARTMNSATTTTTATATAASIKESTASPSTRARFSELSKMYADMEDDVPVIKPSTPTKAVPVATKRPAPQPPSSSLKKAVLLEPGEPSGSTDSGTGTKKRAPSPPGKARAVVDRTSSPPKQKRWEIIERTTIATTHATMTTQEKPATQIAKQSQSEVVSDALMDSVGNSAFAKAQAVAKAREERAAVKTATSCSVKENDPSVAKVAEKAKGFEKAAEQIINEKPVQVLHKSKVVPRGKIAEKVSQFDVGTSGPRCVIETKSLGSVSSRAKFFEKAMEADRRAADAVYVPVSQRTANDLDKDDRPVSNTFRAVKPVLCDLTLSPTKKPLVVPQPGHVRSSQRQELLLEEDETLEDEELEAEITMIDQDKNPDQQQHAQPVEESMESSSNQLEDETTSEEFLPETQCPTKDEAPKKVGQVSNKLKNRLEDMMVYGHKTPDETLLSVSERCEGNQECEDTAFREPDEDAEGFQPAQAADPYSNDSLLSPKLPRRSEHLIDEDTISRITGIPEDGHSTPLSKQLPSTEDNMTTPIAKTMSQYRREQKQAVEQREADVKRIVYQIPSNMIQELRKGKDSPMPSEAGCSLEAYRRQIEEEIVKQESIMKQTSHALTVCQDSGDRGSEQQVEAERLLLIATQRHQAAQSELHRLNAQNRVPEPRGTLTLCDIKLPFKKEFLKLMRSCNDLLDNTHYFIVLVRSGASLLHTELVSTNEKVQGGAVHLTHHMVLKNLHEGFRVFVDVYAVEAPNRHHPDYESTMKKLRREKEKEQHTHRGGILGAFTPSKKKPCSSHTGPGFSDDAGKVRKPSFGLIGRVTLDEDLIGLNRDVHYLDNYFNESPLDGRIFMKIQLNMPLKVTHCGMLRLKDSNGMFGSVDFIKSFFAAIEGSRLNFWNDMREAEEEQEPIRSFDLSQAAATIQLEQSFNFFYFPLRLNNGLELLLLTYSESESSVWAEKLNACITSLKSRKY